MCDTRYGIGPVVSTLAITYCYTLFITTIRIACMAQNAANSPFRTWPKDVLRFSR